MRADRELKLLKSSSVDDDARAERAKTWRLEFLSSNTATAMIQQQLNDAVAIVLALQFGFGLWREYGIGCAQAQLAASWPLRPCER